MVSELQLIGLPETIEGKALASSWESSIRGLTFIGPCDTCHPQPEVEGMALPPH